MEYDLLRNNYSEYVFYQCVVKIMLDHSIWNTMRDGLKRLERYLD